MSSVEATTVSSVVEPALDSQEVRVYSNDGECGAFSESVRPEAIPSGGESEAVSEGGRSKVIRGGGESEVVSEVVSGDGETEAAAGCHQSGKVSITDIEVSVIDGNVRFCMKLYIPPKWIK